MTKLTSKLQYNNFETGEFIEEKERTYEETISLIEAFPWVAQRDHLLVSLTNPSITLESRNNDFLKLAVFFNNKFVLHYFSPEDELFSKSFTCLPDIYSYINNYFQSTAFDTSHFRKENTWLQHNRKHFISQSFQYEITPASIRSFLWKTSGINFLGTIFLFCSFFVKIISFLLTPVIIPVLVIIFFMGGGINLVLVLNYYRYAKNKILIMSKGNDIFYYGNKKSPVRYSKKDILWFKIINPSGRNNPLNAFAIIIIDFNDVSTIKIPNLLIDYIALKQKLIGCIEVEKNGFPYIKS